MTPPVQATKTVFATPGARSHFLAEVTATLRRGETPGESYFDFYRRKLMFLNAIPQVRSNVPAANYDTRGVLAISREDLAVYATSGSTSAGATTIIITSSVTSFIGERWYITDGTSFELLTITSDQVAQADIDVAATTYGYASGAVVFKPLAWLINAEMSEGARIPGPEDPVSAAAARDMALRFVSIDQIGFQS